MNQKDIGIIKDQAGMLVNIFSELKKDFISCERPPIEESEEINEIIQECKLVYREKEEYYKAVKRKPEKYFEYIESWDQNFHEELFDLYHYEPGGLHIINEKLHVFLDGDSLGMYLSDREI